MNRFVLLLLGVLLLVGCSGNDGVTETPPVAEVGATETAMPTAPVAMVASATAVATLEPTLTETPAPTDAPPTFTPTPTITPTPTATPIPAAPVTAITLQRVTDYTFLKPTYLTHAGDDRLFVTEQQGVIRIIQGGQVLPEPFLYIVEAVGSTQYEQGLLSVAFHPNYRGNGRFFVNYTNRNGDTVISAWRVNAENPNVADYGSEQILLTIRQPYANHNGGQIKFGPDGYLYVGMGDGGSANDPLGAGQDLDTLLGKMLRLDVDFNPDGYAIPARNPFVNNDAARNEIWAYGVRNPWRFSFDRLTGDMFMADVGQNQWEEINWQPADSAGGENYGWNIMEASHCFTNSNCDETGLVLPIFEYGHELGCSVTGGYMSRGMADLALYGNYFLADFCQGTIWSLFPDEGGSWQANVVYQGAGNVSSFGEDVHGGLYVVDQLGGVYRIRP